MVYLPRIKFVYDPEMPWFDHWKTAMDDKDSPEYGHQFCLMFGWAVVFW